MYPVTFSHSLCVPIRQMLKKVEPLCMCRVYSRLGNLSTTHFHRVIRFFTKDGLRLCKRLRHHNSTETVQFLKYFCIYKHAYEF